MSSNVFPGMILSLGRLTRTTERHWHVIVGYVRAEFQQSQEITVSIFGSMSEVQSRE